MNLFFVAVLLFYRLVKTKELIHVEWKELRVDRKILGQIMRIGLPAGIQSAVFAVANIVIQSAINSLGTVVMAVFPSHKTFAGILTAYPVSLSVTAVLIFIVLVIYHPSKRFQTDKGEM